MKLLECIDDSNYQPQMLQFIDVFPVLGDIYELRKKVITGQGKVGYLLDEIINPLMPNGYEPNFARERFREIENISIDNLMEEVEDVVTY